MSSALALITGDIANSKAAFMSALSNKSISFERESGFAIQMIAKNDYSLKVASGNRQSVIDAVTNIAAIGISLNPAKKQAYLVPRKNEICLDISYIGLLDIAIESGSIKWGQCKIVRANDNFELNRLDELPTHQYKPFAKNDERGDIVGVYVVVKTCDGDYLTHDMPIDKIFEIRSRSESFKRNSGPWVTDEEEMIKKTCVKQGYKYWPKTDQLDKAIHYLNTDGGEGIPFDSQSNKTENDIDITPLISAAKATTTDSEALKFWKDNNGQLIKYPSAHKQLKDIVSLHRASLQELEKKTIDTPAQDNSDFVAAMDQAGAK